jgi:hypothetical protein
MNLKTEREREPDRERERADIHYYAGRSDSLGIIVLLAKGSVSSIL